MEKKNRTCLLKVMYMTYMGIYQYGKQQQQQQQAKEVD